MVAQEALVGTEGWLWPASREISSGTRRLSTGGTSAGLTLPKSVDVPVLRQSH